MVCRELHVLANLLSVEKAGGGSREGAVLSGFLETEIGGVRLRDQMFFMLWKKKCEA